MMIDVSGPMRSSRWARPLFLAVSALVLALAIVVAHEVMLPIVLGALIAYVLMPIVSWVERRRIPRGFAIVLVYVLVLGSMGSFVRVIAPRMGSELSGLAREFPAFATRARQHWIPVIRDRLRVLVPPPPSAATGPAAAAPDEPAFVIKPRPDGSFAVEIVDGIAIRRTREGNVIDRDRDNEGFDVDKMIDASMQASAAYVRENAIELARIGSGIVFGIGRFFFVFGLTLMIAAYLMLTKERVEGFCVSLVRPSTRPSFHFLLDRVDRGLSGVVRGQLIICLVNGLLSAIGFGLLGLKYWPVLAIVATVLSLIPIFGAVISAVPAVAIGLTQSFWTGVLALVWILAIHQLEANFLNPKIMGDAAKIHPVLVIFSLLVGEHFFHTTGALLAVPCMSITQSVFLHFRQVVQKTDPELMREPIHSTFPPPPPATRTTPPPDEPPPTPV
jgi:predicted PurR-regulated permease PerM